jgi:hypothetical protein
VDNNKENKMTRSDLMLEVTKLNTMTGEEKTLLILQMHNKIENVYKICFGLEKDRHSFGPVGELLRKALEG